MFTANPFAELSFSPEVMQIYVVAMILLVIGGTIFDVIHKKSAKYFSENAKKAESQAKRTLSGGEKAGLAVKTVANEVLTSSEFANTKRRISHIFTMYGFILFVVMTAVLIFAYPTKADAAPTILPILWHVGALMLMFGGYWFWFFIRVDVSSEGKKWYQLARADLFIVSLLMMATFGFIWSVLQSNGVTPWDTLAFIVFIAASTTLFSTVIWSKFAHMFFKPAAAYQKKVTRADGSQENLPDLGDLTDPALQARYPDIPEYMGQNPSYMGLGIKRSEPSNY
jgi:hypothetical protein